MKYYNRCLIAEGCAVFRALAEREKRKERARKRWSWLLRILEVE